MSYFVFV